MPYDRMLHTQTTMAEKIEISTAMRFIWWPESLYLAFIFSKDGRKKHRTTATAT
jgi:hypothetical protein